MACEWVYLIGKGSMAILGAGGERAALEVVKGGPKRLREADSEQGVVASKPPQ